MSTGTQGLLLAGTKGSGRLTELLARALRTQGYSRWNTALPRDYQAQAHEVVRFQSILTEGVQGVSVQPPGEVHHWALRVHRLATSLPLLSIYREASEYWVGKYLADGRHCWKTRECLDLEVDYPIPVLKRREQFESAAREKEQGNLFHKDFPLEEGGLPPKELGRWFAAWNWSPPQDKTPWTEEEVWLEKSSPLVMHSMEDIR